MRKYQLAEIAVALCCGLIFAAVGWWEIARDISRVFN
jgi:hypothetical protein